MWDLEWQKILLQSTKHFGFKTLDLGQNARSKCIEGISYSLLLIYGVGCHHEIDENA
jgi:hypothetical protein